ncbi:VF530 family DNA-binding protein [Bernardetia sp. OM2101]|uniref:VF530 family protein n=1 Tax=Bernardetia sp. OM2101 TaxID=3344876 RepID=UPI0035D01B99
MDEKSTSQNEQPNNHSNHKSNDPLHGVKLADILEILVEKQGWEKMAKQVNINCFKNNPSIKSSLTFLRKTPWAREQVEKFYLNVIKK